MERRPRRTTCRPRGRRDAADDDQDQDQALIGWLAARPALPTLTRDRLIDVLIVWELFAPLPPITAQPSGGTQVDTGDLLREIDQRLLQHLSP